MKIPRSLIHEPKQARFACNLPRFFNPRAETSAASHEYITKFIKKCVEKVRKKTDVSMVLPLPQWIKATDKSTRNVTFK